MCPSNETNMVLNPTIVEINEKISPHGGGRSLEIGSTVLISHPKMTNNAPTPIQREDSKRVRMPICNLLSAQELVGTDIVVHQLPQVNAVSESER
jgi:hypothetical protein